MNYFLFALLWIIYLTLHSILAGDGVKLFFQRILGRGYRYYRFFYASIATIGLLALLMLNAALPDLFHYNRSGLAKYIGLILAVCGSIVIGKAFREYRFASFIGLTSEQHEFKRTGILNYVRHPIYSGTILIVIGFFLFFPTLGTLISAGCILCYLPVGIHFEEKKLIRQFGDQYLAYKKEVPSVLPRLKK